MKLSHITFAGVDIATNIRTVKMLKEQFPFAQFAICTSFECNKNIFANPRFIASIPAKADFDFFLEINGKAAECIQKGDWTKIDLLTESSRLLNKIKLNIANNKFIAEAPKNIPAWIKEITIQENYIYNTWRYRVFLEQCKPNNKINLFIENIDFKANYEKVLTLNNTIKFKKLPKIGFNTDFDTITVAQTLYELLNINQNIEFWLEVRNAVRTDEWMDLYKVQKTLLLCEAIILDHEKKTNKTK